MKNSIMICADDFGMHPAIDNGILTLLEKQKISAVSCMTNETYWEQDAPSLIPYFNRAKIGLHFNLPYRSLAVFILKSYLRILTKQQIYQALNNQYERFIKIMGRKPDFIDGHQHIHQLPVIRDVVIEFYQMHYVDRQGFIRNTQNKQKNCIKAKVINLLGGNRLKKLLKKYGIPHNAHFSGIYNLSEKKDYSTLLRQFVADIEGDGLIMCHPANDYPERGELFRVNEFNVLNNYSSSFTELKNH